jgi:hypothetical protein
MRPRVLVGFAESLAAIETIWDLLDVGYEVHALTRVGRRPPIRHDHRVRIIEVRAPEVSVSGCAADVATAAARLGRPPLMPLDDAAVIVMAAVAATDADTVVVGPTSSNAVLATDKRLQIELAERSGIPVPPTVVVDVGSGTMPTFPGPWIVKPAVALDTGADRLSKGSAAYVTTGEELRDDLARRTERVLVQPVLSGNGVGIFGYAHAGQPGTLSGHERIRMMNPSGSGSSACRSRTPASELSDSVARLLKDCSWEGLFMIELLEDSTGTPWFMELNGRAWGSMALATGRGLHYPSWAVAATTGTATAPTDAPDAPPLTARHVGRELLHLAFVVRGRREVRRRTRLGQPIPPDLAGYPSTPAAMRAVLGVSRPTQFYNLRRRHLRVFVADVWQTLRSVVPRRTAP